MKRTLLLAALLAAGVAQAQPAPHGPPGPPPPGPPGAPSPEALASVPDLDASKQIEVRKLLIQRGDAHDALRVKEDAERDAMKSRYRAEHERIDDDSSARLRKLLGDDGYRALAAWLVGPRGGMGPGTPGPDRPRGDRRPPGPATGPNDPAHPAAPGPTTGFNDAAHPAPPGPATGFNDPAPPVPPEPDHDGADPEARVR